MANYKYTADLKADALFRAGESTDGSSEYDAKALEFLNRVYQGIVTGISELNLGATEDWVWARENAVLTLEPAIETGTVNVTKNSTSITLSVAPTNSVQTYFFKVEGHADVFKVQSHTAMNAGATLDSVYTGETNSAASYRLFLLEYGLPTNFIRFPQPFGTRSTSNFFPFERGKIHSMDHSIMREKFPLDRLTAGIPSLYAQVGEKTVQFNTYPSDLLRVSIPYIKLPDMLTGASLEEPLIPEQNRKTLADGALFFLFSAKNDNRADGIGIMTKNGIDAMAIENRRIRWSRSSEFGRIMPRPTETNIIDQRFVVRLP